MSGALACGEVDTRLGPLLVACSERGVCFIKLQPEGARAAFDRWRERHFAAAEVTAASELLDRAHTQLVQFSEGARRSFDLPLHLIGTEFQRRVWDELLRIPHGATRTYGEVARAIGKPGASRAVGLANNRNPVPIIVPCHRVVAAGGMGGFGGGLDLKQRLLVLEGCVLPFSD